MEKSSRNYAVDGEILTSAQEQSRGIAPTALGHKIALADPDPQRQAPDDERVAQEPRSDIKVLGPLIDRVQQQKVAAEDSAKHAVWLHGAYRAAMDRASLFH
jgi:hypothetical protein